MREPRQFGTRVKVGLSLLVAGLAAAVLGATPAHANVETQAVQAQQLRWPTVTVWCQYRVTATAGLNERWGPGTGYGVVRLLPYGTLVIAGKDGVVTADGYTWRHFADAYQGWAISPYLQKTSAQCFT